MALVVGAFALTPPCFAGDERPAKPTDNIPSWKDAVDSPMLAYSYPGWTPPLVMEYPFVPPEKRTPEETDPKVCITATEARQLVMILDNAAQQEIELELTVKALDDANKRINYLESQIYESEANFKELSKRYIKLQEELLFAEKKTTTPR